MKLCSRSLAIASGLLLGGAVLAVGIAASLNGVGESGGYYGKDFMLTVASVYPGYRGVPEIGDAVIGGLYGFVDGAVGGWILAKLYNLLTPSS